MKRKVVSVILCGTMVLGMVTGCGSSKGGDSGDKVQSICIRTNQRFQVSFRKPLISIQKKIQM